jgi:hypothetical protein
MGAQTNMVTSPVASKLMFSNRIITHMADRNPPRDKLISVNVKEVSDIEETVNERNLVAMRNLVRGIMFSVGISSIVLPKPMDIILPVNPEYTAKSIYSLELSDI